MKERNPLTKLRLFALLVSCLLINIAIAQDDDDSVYELSPFIIDSSGDSGYYASQTLAGGRTATDIRNTGTSIEIVTKELLEDIGGKTVEEFLQYTTGGEVGGSQGNFVGAGIDSRGGNIDSSSIRRNPIQNTRLRGLGWPDYVRNYYKTSIPMDGYNTGRVDINRGANSFLFGLGSPAGLVNSSYQIAEFTNRTQIDTRIGSGGSRPSYRGSFGINRVILDDTLAIRINGLHDRHQYRQKPSYKNDDRLFTAVTYKPLKNTTIKAHFENGTIKGNAPDTVLPTEAFSSFIKYRTPVDFYYNMQHFGDPEGPEYEEWLAMSPEDQAKFSWIDGPDGQDRGSNDILSGAGIWGLAMVYDGANGRDPSFGIRPQFPSASWERGEDEGNEPGDTFWDPAILADGSQGGRSDGSPTMLFYDNMRYDSSRGGTGPAQAFLSLNGFDFSKRNWAGNNDYHNREFTTYNVTLEQLFLNGKLGFEMGFDYEDVERDAVTNFGGWSGMFRIDINKTLPLPALNADGSLKRDADGNVIPEVRENPNFGRPFYATNTNKSRSFEEKETMRFTAFFKHNFADSHPDNKFLKWLGNHTITVLGDKFTDKQRSANSKVQSFSDDYNLPWHIGNGLASDPSAAYRGLTKMVYMGPAIQSYINDPFNPNTSIGISDIIITPPDADLLADNPRLPFNYWSFGPDAEASRWNSIGDMESDELGLHPVGDNKLVFEPESYTGDTREYWDSAELEGRWTTSGSNRVRKTIVKSWAVNMQSMFFHDHLVANVGYREDKVENWLNETPPSMWDLYNEGLVGPEFEGDETYTAEPQYFKAENGTYTEIDKGPTGSGSFGYGGVLHIPQNLLIANLPDWMNVSLHYNFSKNFVPDASRLTFKPGGKNKDWYWGPLSSPIGEGKDWGFTLNFNNNKFVARFNWYESSIKNGDSGLGHSVNGLIYTAINARLWAIEDIKDADPDGNQIIDVNEDGETHWMANNERWDISRVYQVLDATQWLETDGFIQSKEENNILTYRQDGRMKRQQWYPGLVDTQDLVAKGFELNLTYNPTRSWRIMMNASKNESVTSNIAPLYTHVLNRYFESYNEIKNYTYWEAHDTRATKPMSRWMQDQVNTYYARKLQEGASSNEVRKWRVNLITNYTFHDGNLKGFSVGGAVRWQSSGAIGYPLMEYEVSEGIVMNVPNVHAPWDSKENWNIDINTGYKRKILNKKIEWNCRLHIRNINNLNSDQLSTFRVNYDGTPAARRWDPPMTIFLTNSFKF